LVERAAQSTFDSSFSRYSLLTRRDIFLLRRRTPEGNRGRCGFSGEISGYDPFRKIAGRYVPFFST
jgi:hypothetical protein